MAFSDECAVMASDQGTWLGRSIAITRVVANLAAGGGGYDASNGRRQAAQTIAPVTVTAVRDVVGQERVRRQERVRSSATGGSTTVETVEYRVGAAALAAALGGDELPREGWTIEDPPSSGNVYRVVGVTREAEGAVLVLRCRQSQRGAGV